MHWVCVRASQCSALRGIATDSVQSLVQKPTVFVSKNTMIGDGEDTRVI